MRPIRSTQTGQGPRKVLDRTRFSARTLATLCTLGLLLTGPLRPAQAEDFTQRFGTDAGNAETFWSLLQRTVHLEAGVGIFWAHLSGGLTSLTAALDNEGVSKAINAVSTGSGFVREVRFGLEVAGNEAFFTYLSDRLFAAAEDEVKENVRNPYAQDLILMLVGELRPDLGDLLGPDAKTWLKVEYGRFEGSIDEAWRFATRSGRPWFGENGAGWRSNYLSVDAGVFPDGRGHLNEFSKQHREGGDEGIGLFARYSRLGRPTVLGFGDEVGSEGGYVLEDSELTTYAVGIRAELLFCDNACLRMSGTMVPFTAVSNLDLGRLGSLWGGLFATGFELKASYPIDIFGVLALSPYASFRADFMLPMLGDGAGSIFDVSITKVQFWLPDYLLWGPTAGITGMF